MFELTPSDFPCALPLLASIQQAVLPYAICQGINPGRVFVDQGEDPHVALCWTTVGYYLLAGDPEQGLNLADLSQVLTGTFIPNSQAGGENSFILMTSASGWQQHLPTLLPAREVIEIYRRPFAFERDKFAARGDWHSRIPSGMRLQALDATLAERAGVLASWASLDDFLAHGLGFALLDGDQIASLCLSVLASREKVEIDVHTHENYRRQGLAVIAASALIEACLQQGIQPNWECFWDNQPSAALAEHLGFTPLPDYPVYYWEEAGQGE